jgi:hypothetical protein
MSSVPKADAAVAAALFGQAQQAALLQLRATVATQLLGFLLVGYVAHPEEVGIDDPQKRDELAVNAVECGDDLVRVLLRTPFSPQRKTPVL